MGIIKTTKEVWTNLNSNIDTEWGINKATWEILSNFVGVNRATWEVLTSLNYNLSFRIGGQVRSYETHRPRFVEIVPPTLFH
jgi:hypothetical protein